MRLLNEFIYTLIFLLLFASARLFGQTQGNAIYLIDSANNAENGTLALCGTGGNCWQYDESLNVGDVIVVAASQENVNDGCNGLANPPWTFSDSLANTFHTQTSSVNVLGDVYMQMSCMQVTNSGADQITVTGLNTNTGCASSIAMSRFANASCNLDGSIQNGATTVLPAPQSMSTSTTTTVNGVMLVSAGVDGRAGGGTPIPDGSFAEYSTLAGANGGAQSNVAMEYGPTGNLGTYSMGMAICCSPISGTSNGMMQTIALKPATTIAIADTALPDAAANVAYSAQLHCTGGILTPTYSLFSGSFPAGISLNASTGAISGSTSSVGTSILGFRCTDGTNTSATQTLTLKVGAAFNSVVVKSAATFSADLQPGNVNVTASCGDVIVVCPNGADTHHGIGWMQATSGANNSWSDSFGSPVQRFVTNAGFAPAPMACYVFGPLLQSGSDQLSFKNGGGGSSGLPPVLVEDISGAQNVIDIGTQKTSSGTALTSIAQSLTTPVANEYVLASTVVENTAATISFGAPFSLIASGNDGGINAKAFADTTVASPSTVTATSTISSTAGTATTLLMGLRPSVVGGCAFTGAGEKKRRAMN